MHADNPWKLENQYEIKFMFSWAKNTFVTWNFMITKCEQKVAQFSISCTASSADLVNWFFLIVEEEIYPKNEVQMAGGKIEQLFRKPLGFKEIGEH